MKEYIFDKKDSGIVGKAFEMAVKDALNRKNADKVSPCGCADFRWHNKNYDTKQNGSTIKYGNSAKYIKGSNRVIYATHVAHTVVAETEKEITITVDLANTEMFVLDRMEFVNYLLDNNCAKLNVSRRTVNIQTMWNYKEDKYHGRKPIVLEKWAYEHDLGDDIIGAILEGL